MNQPDKQPTSGVWQYTFKEDGPADERYILGKIYARNGNHYAAIAEIFYPTQYGHDLGDQEANGLMMAAAKEMYAVCEAVYHGWTGQDLTEMAKQAIQKAKGITP